MLCPNCGVDVGEKIGLCPKCTAERGVTGGAGLGLTPKPPSSQGGPNESHPLTSAPPTSDFDHAAHLDLDPASFWARFFAFLLDLCILRTLFFGVEPVLAMMNLDPVTRFVTFVVPRILQIGNEMQLAVLSFFFPIIALVVAWLLFEFLLYLVYSSVLESSPLQGTVGKYAFGLVVTTFDDRPISFIQAILRALLKIASAAPLFLGFLLAAFFDKCAVHDVLSGTRVRECYRVTRKGKFFAGIGTVLFCVVLVLVQKIRTGDNASFSVSINRGESARTSSSEAPAGPGAKALIERDEIGFVNVGSERYPIQGFVAHVEREKSILRLGLYGKPVDPILAGKLEEARSLYALPELQPTVVLELRFSRGTRYCTPESLPMFVVTLMPGGPIPLPPEMPQFEAVRAGGALVFNAFRELTCAFEPGSLLNITFQDEGSIETATTKSPLQIFFRGQTRIVVIG